MTSHVIRPKYWSQQVVLLLPQLVAGDVIVIDAVGPCADRAVRMMLAEWGIKKIRVTDTYPQRTASCLRCGSEVFGDFCESCENGTLHKQTCGQLWRGMPPGSNVEYLVNKGLTASPDTPCNCGGDELERTIRHAADNLRL